jgi:diphthamide biosynthesis enzyme Dph1/Dph2-like protein
MQNYDLEIDKVISEIKKSNVKTILLQLPDGLKPLAKKIVDNIKSKTKSDVLIWFGTCYGACDIPTNISGLKIDLVVQWGHNSFRRIEGW